MRSQLEAVVRVVRGVAAVQKFIYTSGQFLFSVASGIFCDFWRFLPRLKTERATALGGRKKKDFALKTEKYQGGPISATFEVASAREFGASGEAGFACFLAVWRCTAGQPRLAHTHPCSPGAAPAGLHVCVCSQAPLSNAPLDCGPCCGRSLTRNRRNG